MFYRVRNSLIYLIFSTLFISTTAFFINDNYSFRIFFSTINFTLRNYTWAIILLSIYIYIYRIEDVKLRSLMVFILIITIIYLIFIFFFDKFDYTSLSRNSYNELYINREVIERFNILDNKFLQYLLFRVKSYKLHYTHLLFTAFLLFYIKNRLNAGLCILSLSFLLTVVIIVLPFINPYCYLMFNIVLCRVGSRR